MVDVYFVYILYSPFLNSYYIGSCKDVEERLKKHLANHKGYTGRAKDWQIMYTEKFLNKTEALIREKLLKGWKNRERLKQLINRDPAG